MPRSSNFFFQARALPASSTNPLPDNVLSWDSPRANLHRFHAPAGKLFDHRIGREIWNAGSNTPMGILRIEPGDRLLSSDWAKVLYRLKQTAAAWRGGGSSQQTAGRRKFVHPGNWGRASVPSVFCSGSLRVMPCPSTNGSCSKRCLRCACIIPIPHWNKIETYVAPLSSIDLKICPPTSG